MEWQFLACEDGFDLHFADRLVLRHRISCPTLVMARGKAQIEMRHGNFRIDDAPTGHVAPLDWIASDDGLIFSHEGLSAARLSWADNILTVEAIDPSIDRLWLSFHAGPSETVWGGGEQMSYLALNGRRFPIWTSEPGVGRDKSTALTQTMDAQGMAGGDYWTTNYPQPTFLTSRWLAVHRHSRK